MDQENKLIKQYELLQARINLHGTRMWQLPFTYLGLIGVILSVTINAQETGEFVWIFAGLSCLGLILFWALYGAYEGYSRTAKAMNQVEKELKLNEYTKCYKSHYVPYFSLVGLGILVSLSAFFVF